MKYSLVVVFFALSMLCTCSKKSSHVIIETNFGNIEAELFTAKAPKSCAAFLSYIDSGYYKNASFYRLTFMEAMASGDNTGVIQGGIWQTNKTDLKIPGILHESPKQTGLTHSDGTLSLARTTVGSANTEFFICIGDQSEYDSSKALNADGLGYAAFGRVINGMDIVKKIHNQPSKGDMFTPPLVILNIKKQ
jgi:peptidyl-prolyl cis-trans isomerase A (cyclophilin A)